MNLLVYIVIKIVYIVIKIGVYIVHITGVHDIDVFSELDQDQETS